LSQRVSLPKRRSRLKKSNKYQWVKNLTEQQEHWLRLHEKSNWNQIGLNQEYLKRKKRGDKQITMVVWKLPGTEQPKEDCGKWKYKGCDRCDYHPNKKFYVEKRKLGCFRACCKKCWLTKWLARESNRATRRIENYESCMKKYGFPRSKPIHVIVSPSWDDKFQRYDILKEHCNRILENSGLYASLVIYHPFSFDKDKGEWVVRPHFHVIGFGWVKQVKEEAEKRKWVVKNKGIRKSLHSTIYYQLSHCGVAKGVHSVFYFGGLGYRAKYATEIKVVDDEVEKLQRSLCPFCYFSLGDVEYVGLDRPPPDKEFMMLSDPKYWRFLPSQCVKNSRGDFEFNDREGIGSEKY